MLEDEGVVVDDDTPFPDDLDIPGEDDTDIPEDAEIDDRAGCHE